MAIVARVLPARPRIADTWHDGTHGIASRICRFQSSTLVCGNGEVAAFPLEANSNLTGRRVVAAPEHPCFLVGLSLYW